MKSKIAKLKTISIFLILFYYSTSFDGCKQAVFEIKKFMGLETISRYHLDVMVDITNSRELEEELPKDSLFVANLIEQLQVKDHLEVYFIHARTYSKLEKVFEARMPQKPGVYERILKDKKIQALKKFPNEWQTHVQEVFEKQLYRWTDLVGAFLFLKGHKVNSLKHKIVIISDMLAVRKNQWNFEKAPPPLSLLDDWQKQRIIPDLKDKEVFIFGTYSPQISNDHYLAVKQFWEEFFIKAHASLMSYQYQRDPGLLFN